jgi:hypothetical protein
MMENEDSVVTSLNELRKLKNERISRQTQSRGIAVGNRASALAEDPLADQLTPPPSQAFAQVQVPASFQRDAAFAVPAPDRFAPAQVAYDHAAIAAPPVIRTKTSYKAAVVMSVLLVGGAGAGYMKLQQDTQAALAAKDASIKNAEEARGRAVETAAKADQVAKASLRQCEEKLRTALASVAAPVPTAAPAAPAAEKKPEKAVVASKATRASRRVAARSPRQPAAAAEKDTAKDKSGDVPTIAKKKKVNDDPLAGLGKL